MDGYYSAGLIYHAWIGINPSCHAPTVSITWLVLLCASSLLGITWKLGDTLSLPFANDSFEGYTVAFGLRNMANFDQVRKKTGQQRLYCVWLIPVDGVPQALSEAARVLVPGGRFLCMEFSKVSNPLFRWWVSKPSVAMIKWLSFMSVSLGCI